MAIIETLKYHSLKILKEKLTSSEDSAFLDTVRHRATAEGGRGIYVVFPEYEYHLFLYDVYYY